MKLNGNIYLSKIKNFDTIVVRRLDETTEDAINLREIQTWVNGVNIMINNGLTSYFAMWSDKETDAGFYLTHDSTLVYNDIIQSGFETHSNPNQANALIIKNIPLTSINEIQAIVYYNRTGPLYFSPKAIGLIIELYNSTIDPNLNDVLATTNEITTASETYRFDFPSISTYTAFVDGISITNIVNNLFALTEVANVIFLPTEINGEVVIAGDLTANNFIVGSTNLITEITDLQGRLNTEEPKISSLESITSSLATQISEIELTPGPQGLQGIQGETGLQGIQGETGLQVIQGETGLQGIQGETGLQGIQGETGLQGIKGDTGLQGIQGETGLQGIQGETGLQGLKGDTGLQGIKGETGLKVFRAKQDYKVFRAKLDYKV